MNIIVVVALVPETDVSIKVENEKNIKVSNNKFIINPLDEFAIEEALRTKEKFGGEVKVIVYSILNSVENDELLTRSILARGIDKAVLLKNISCNSSKNIAKNIIDAMDNKLPDVLFFGYKNMFLNSIELPVIVANMLNYNYITGIIQLEIREMELICKKETEIGYNIISTKFPCVLSTHKGLNEPRYPKLIEIMKAKQKTISIMEANNDEQNILPVEKISLVYDSREKISLSDTDEDIIKLYEIIKSKLS